jgi:hypothetical protein
MIMRMMLLQVTVTHISCDISGVNITISFVNLSGQVNGLNAVSAGLERIQKVLADPLTSQYGLSLVRIVAHRLGERSQHMQICLMLFHGY